MSNGPSDLSVNDIRGIWVVSDDIQVVRAVNDIARDHFPNVSSVVNISAKDGRALSNASSKQVSQSPAGGVGGEGLLVGRDRATQFQGVD